MSILAVQFDIVWEDKQANFAAVRDMLAGAKVPRGALIVLPEMYATGFSMNVGANAEDVDGPAHAFAGEVAMAHDCWVLAGITTANADGRGRNEAVVFGPDGRMVGRYCKMHPFTFAGEDDHYAAGEDGWLFQWGGFTVAPLICYDLRFPETFRQAVTRGANMFVVIASWPAVRSTHWSTLLAARAIENQAYVVGVNRCGRDPHCQYAGGSVVIDPRGEEIASAGTEPTILAAEPDLQALLEYRRSFPVLNDRR